MYGILYYADTLIMSDLFSYRAQIMIVLCKCFFFSRISLPEWEADLIGSSLNTNQTAPEPESALIRHCCPNM